MIRRARFFIMVVLAWVASLWRFPQLPGPLGVPDGILLILLAWAFSQRDRLPASMPLGIGALLGALKDLSGSGVPGGWMIAFAAVAWFAVQGNRTMERDHPLAQVAWVTVFSMAGMLIYFLCLAGSDDRLRWSTLLFYYWIPSSVVTGLFSIPLFPILKRTVSTGPSRASRLA